eukprot:6661460-Alexandrium_andersonii.AAC.1
MAPTTVARAPFLGHGWRRAASIGMDSDVHARITRFPAAGQWPPGSGAGQAVCAAGRPTPRARLARRPR